MFGVYEQATRSIAIVGSRACRHPNYPKPWLYYTLQVAAAFARKKAVAAERKQKKDQKEEAEKFLERQQQLVRQGGREPQRCSRPNVQ